MSQFALLAPQEQTDSAPDIETASDNYASRFAGEVGEYFLEVQREKIFSLLGPGPSRKILEVGAGHGQLTLHLLRAGHSVVVQGSSEESLNRARPFLVKFPGQLELRVSPLLELPFPDKSFDSVIAIRLLSHLESWQLMVREMARVSKDQVIFDFAPGGSFNFFYPLLFVLKKFIEKNTRTYLRFSRTDVISALEHANCELSAVQRQFFLPMVFHRFLKTPRISKAIEKCFELLGLTNLVGSPALALAKSQARSCR